MQYDQQELYYGSDPHYCANERVVYLNPMNICEELHTFRIGKNNEELEGLEGEEREKKIADMKKQFDAKYAFYIGNAMIQFQDRESVVAPYNFG